MDTVDALQEIVSLVNWERMRPVLQSFHEATGVPIRIVDRRGNVLVEKGDRPLCFNYNRRESSTVRHCLANEKRLWEKVEAGDSFVCCPCGNGLLDSACPVIVDGERVATVMTGQLLPGPPDLAWFAEHARRHGFPVDAYLAVVERLPVLSLIRIRACLDYCAGTAAMLADQALRFRRFTKAFRDKASSLLDMSQDICVCVDQSMTICDANSHAAASIGVAVEELVGRRCYEIWHGFDEPCEDCVVRDALNSGKVASRQSKNVAGRWLDIRGYPLQDEQAAQRHVVVTVSDISRIKQAEEQARSQREAMDRAMHAAAIGELATTVSHELSQPLSAILANAQAAQRLLNGDTPDIAECREALREVADDAWRAGEGLKRLRCMTGGAKGDAAQVDVRRLVRDTVRLMLPEIDALSCELVMRTGATDVRVEGDPEQLQQVIIHMIRNACEAMQDVPERRLEIALTVDGWFCCVEVTDSGPGLTVEAADALYNLFFTTKGSPIGAGLAIARSVVEAHGGSIAAGNAEAGGACFNVRLPLVADKR